MISRIWHGYTPPGNADAYEELLRDDITTGIEDRTIDGFREIQVFRRHLGDEVEFIEGRWFDSLVAVRASPARTAKPRWCQPRPASYSHAPTSGPSTMRCASGGSRSAGPIATTKRCLPPHVAKSARQEL
jgi:hypothetical protein